MPTMPNNAVGERLRELLAQRKISHEEMGRRMGYKNGRPIRRWIAGDSTPGTTNLDRMARALDMPTAELISRLFDDLDSEWTQAP